MMFYAIRHKHSKRLLTGYHRDDFTQLSECYGEDIPHLFETPACAAMALQGKGNHYYYHTFAKEDLEVVGVNVEVDEE
jgi:hypothetical protein